MVAGDEAPVSPTEMAVAEVNAVALGLTIDQLMENAGRAVAEEAARRLPPAPARVAVLAGPGNNGGDGTCAAFYLGQWGYTPEVWLVRPASEIRTPSARRCFERVSARFPIRVGVPTPDDLAGVALVLDALLGTGQAPGLRSPYREAARAANSSGAPILAVDVPTGLGGPEAVKPRLTVALTRPKAGMGPANSGEIVVRDIGIPSEALHRTGPGEFLWFPTPDSRGARGRSARVVVIAGGPYAGAPALAALAALRSGAERATVITPSPTASEVRGYSPNLVVEAVGRERFRPEDVGAIVRTLEGARVDALVLGMGAGRDPSTVEAFAGLLEALAPRAPVVVDADALGALTRPGAPRLDPARVVGTPNSGEFERVFGGRSGAPVAERLEVARRAAGSGGFSLVVKGAEDLITDGTATVLNLHHHPASAVAGVGDLLAGVLGSLLAQGVPLLGAARLATYWVGEAGGRAAEGRGYGLIATDVLEALPRALVDGLARVRPPG